ncbi:MAG TPA: pyruvate kinase [Pseudoclavibacter sp.]|nr:pyruvate kinase [Pseudoclavibacter sp.]
MRRAKIVATIGPATDSYEKLHELIEAGLDVARLNLSHGDYSVHQKVYENVRAAAKDVGKPVGVLVDLQGPKIRLGRFADGPHMLEVGDTFTITIDDIEGTKDRCSTTFKGLPEDVKPGDILLIDDGNVSLRATKVTDTDVVTEVVIPGKVSNNKGINLPGVAVNVPALSEKDERDLRWGLKLGADLIALSFVRSADDISRVHEIMDEEGIHLPVCAKIEKPQAVDKLEEIIDAFDMIMVARGDLGVELPLEQVPLVQKKAILLARRWAKPVIVATQMMESMITNSRPTRAEASDVANAVLDGADAVMLSAETSVGAYPVEAVATMAKIIESTEDHGLDRIEPLGTTPHTIPGAVTRAAVDLADFADAKFIAVFSRSGDSARRMSRLRSRFPLLVFTNDYEAQCKMAPYWGVETHALPIVHSTDDMVYCVDEFALAKKRAEIGDYVVVISGSPPGIPGSTNEIRILRIGDAVHGTVPGYVEAGKRVGGFASGV